MASDGQETSRDRVRRILIRPLQEAGMGMKPKKGERPAEREARERAFLDGLADELGYCSDRVLAGLREWAEASGEGTRRTWWPGRPAVRRTCPISCVGRGRGWRRPCKVRPRQRSTRFWPIPLHSRRATCAEKRRGARR